MDKAVLAFIIPRSPCAGILLPQGQKKKPSSPASRTKQKREAKASRFLFGAAVFAYGEDNIAFAKQNIAPAKPESR